MSVATSLRPFLRRITKLPGGPAFWVWDLRKPLPLAETPISERSSVRADLLTETQSLGSIWLRQALSSSEEEGMMVSFRAI